MSTPTSGAEQLWTVASILKKVSDFLIGKGCDTSRLDAEVLLSHALGLKRIELYTRHNRPLLEKELERYRELVRRRAKGEPAAYLVGHKEFYSLDFLVGKGVLVPRPETEFLASAAIDEAKQKDGNVLVVEIGTGSGCVAVAVAVYADNCSVFATEKSAVAAEYARKNINAQDVQQKVTLVVGNMFEPISKMGLTGKIDIVVSNPPYITEDEYRDLPVTVRDYEPKDALVAGKEGTDYYYILAEQSQQYLMPGGLLALELGDGLGEKVCRILQDNGNFDEPWFVKDYSGIDRLILARKSKTEA